MQSGKLRHYVELQAYSHSRNRYGDSVKAWTTFASVYAEIKPIGGSYREYGGREQAKGTHTIKIRYNENIKVNDRVLWNGRYFEIMSVQDSFEETEYIILMTQEEKQTT